MLIEWRIRLDIGVLKMVRCSTAFDIDDHNVNFYTLKEMFYSAGEDAFQSNWNNTTREYLLMVFCLTF